jgi:DNA-binding NarL/FixJ family response regulator
MPTEKKKSNFPRVLLADDHQVILDTEGQILAPEFNIVGAVRDGAAVLLAAAELDPDVITLDITMPEINGLEVARRLRASGSRAKIVFLTVHEDLDFICEALNVGASAYVVKGTMASDLLRAVHAALTGQKFISPSLGFNTSSRSKN